MKKIPIYLAAVSLLMSCSKTREFEQPASSDRIVFGSTIDVATKAVSDTDEQCADGDKIGVLGYHSGTQGETTDFAAPFLNLKDFTYNTSQSLFTTNNANAIWRKGQFHNFYAYYPSILNLGTLGATAPKVALTVGATGIDPTLDIMCAKSVAATAMDGTFSPAQLKFTHRLSKVKFLIVRDELTTASSLTKLEFKMGYNTGSLDVATGNVDKTAGVVSITDASAVSIPTGTPVAVGSGWLVLPGDVVSDISVVVNGSLLNVKGATPTESTEQGKITVITIKLSSKGITCTSKIVSWNTFSADGGLAEPPLPAPTLPKIGDYYYSDKTFSTEYNLPNGKSLVGLVYRIKDNGNYMLLSTNYSDVGWSLVDDLLYAFDEDNGRNNTVKIVNAGYNRYAAVYYCDNLRDGGVSGWYLPAINELKALHAGFSGLRWIPLIAIAKEGEINDWGGGSSMPNNASYGAVRAAFNAKLTAVGGVPISSYYRYWSST